MTLLSNVPDDTHATKGFLRGLLDTVFNKYPELKTYLPVFLNMISKYIPSSIVDNFHSIETTLNDFMNVYRSNLSSEEKIAAIKKNLPDNILSDEDIYKLFSMLDNAMVLINNNVTKYNQYIGENNEANNTNFMEYLNNINNNGNYGGGNGDNDSANYDDGGGDNDSIDSMMSSQNLNLNDVIGNLQKQIVEKTKNSETVREYTPPPSPKNNTFDMSSIFKAYNSKYGNYRQNNEETDQLDLSGDIGLILLKTYDNKNILLDSDEALDLITTYAQKCIEIQNNLRQNNLRQNNLTQIGGSNDNAGAKEGAKEGADNKAQDSGKKDSLLNESEESLKKQYGFMEHLNEAQDNKEVDETNYVPADIGGVGSNLKNDRVLYRFQYDILNNKMNILSRLLIALSAVPVFGWFFDVLLVIYAFFTKDFKLAIYTIVGSLSVIGREFSKALYLLDESQQMKKTLTNPSYARFNVASKDSQEVKKTTPEIINGEYVLVDEDGNIYSPIISKQEKIGELSADKSRVHFFNSTPPQPYKDVNKNIQKESARARTNFIDKFRNILKNNNLNMEIQVPTETEDSQQNKNEQENIKSNNKSNDKKQLNQIIKSNN